MTKIDGKYVRCRFCDSSWFNYTLKNNKSIYKETPKTLQYNCPACNHVQTSRKFNTDKEDLPDNLREIQEDIKKLKYALEPIIYIWNRYNNKFNLVIEHPPWPSLKECIERLGNIKNASMDG